MRTQDQVQAKINELTLQRRAAESRMAILHPDDPLYAGHKAQLERLEDMILMLEWVINAPTGKYHA